MAIITITGTPGSGKSTLARLLAERLGYRHYSIGDLRRKFATEKHITLAELNRRSETGEEDTDTQFDEYQQRLAREERDCIIDSRLGWHFLPQSIKLFIDADERVRAQRILLRDSVAERPISVHHAIQMNRERPASDRQRYIKYYNLDPFEKGHYDLVLDSSATTPEQLTEAVLARFPAPLPEKTKRKPF